MESLSVLNEASSPRLKRNKCPSASQCWSVRRATVAGIPEPPQRHWNLHTSWELRLPFLSLLAMIKYSIGSCQFIRPLSDDNMINGVLEQGVGIKASPVHLAHWLGIAAPPEVVYPLEETKKENRARIYLYYGHAIKSKKNIIIRR